MTTTARPVSRTSDITELFVGKVFRIPGYQRTYAWEARNWEDFWTDIVEGFESYTPHYWGTITLKDTGESKFSREKTARFTVYEVVDGQQRLTTIVLFLLALSRQDEVGVKDQFVRCGEIHRIKLGELNKQFMEDLVDEKNRDPDLRTNRLLHKALGYLQGQVKSFVSSGKDLGGLVEYLLGSTLSLEFQVADENMAVRAFQSLNDRGKELTLLDKAKSFLMFYSARYLDNAMSDNVNKRFGEVFKSFDIIVEAGKKNRIEYIANSRFRFSEDELLRFYYHYFARYSIEKYRISELGYSYTITNYDVFNHFLKRSCDMLRPNRDSLQNFIREFLEGFEQFALAFRLMVSRAAESNAYRRLLSFLGVNASVYPLMIALEAEQIANESMLDLVEKLDLRVYKIRGTEPRADLYRDTISLIKLRPDQEHIKNGMEKVVRDFMGEAEFQAYLARSIYGNPAVKYILWEYENSQDPELGYWQLDYYKDLRVEHIFPVETTLGFPAYGFSEAAEYIASINKLGNLLILEEGINKRVSNEVPTNKAREYLKSCIPGTKRQGYQISTSGFVKADVENRTERIIQFCARRWGLAV